MSTKSDFPGMLTKVPDDLRKRVEDAVLMRLGADTPTKSGHLWDAGGPGQPVRLYRRKTNKERQEERDKGLPADQYLEVGNLPSEEVNQIIARAMSEPDAVDALIKRITLGRDVMKELEERDPKTAEMTRAWVRQYTKEYVDELLRGAQAKQQEQAKAAELPPVPESVKEIVQAELEKPSKYEEPDPNADLLKWAIENHYKPQYDKRGSGTKLKQSWLDKMHTARGAQMIEQVEQEEKKRQKMLEGASS